jgi:hypothetical protein
MPEDPEIMQNVGEDCENNSRGTLLIITETMLFCTKLLSLGFV